MRISKIAGIDKGDTIVINKFPGDGGIIISVHEHSEDNETDAYIVLTAESTQQLIGVLCQTQS